MMDAEIPVSSRHTGWSAVVFPSGEREQVGLVDSQMVVVFAPGDRAAGAAVFESLSVRSESQAAAFPGKHLVRPGRPELCLRRWWLVGHSLDKKRAAVETAKGMGSGAGYRLSFEPPAAAHRVCNSMDQRGLQGRGTGDGARANLAMGGQVVSQKEQNEPNCVCKNKKTKAIISLGGAGAGPKWQNSPGQTDLSAEP
jgi:hypothetical protein